MTSFSKHAGVAVLLLLVSTEDALAQPGFIYSINDESFVTLDLGHAAIGINDLGQIVGQVSPTDGFFPVHGFIRQGSTVTLLDYPGAYFTALSGINNAGQIVGNQCGGAAAPLACTGFFKDGNAFTPFGYPGAIFTYANGINDTGHIAAAYRVEVIVGPNTVQDFDHGLLIEGNVLSAFDVPGAHSTVLLGVNDSVQAVGYYAELTDSWPGFRIRGFLKQGQAVTSIDYPGALFTTASGINNSGQIAGDYTDHYGYRHGFIKTGDTFTSFDFPGADTIPEGINNAGEIVGNYYPRPVIPTINGFISAVSGLGLPQGTANSLVAKLNAAIDAFTTSDLATACTNIGNFNNQVEAQSGKKLTLTQADTLLAAAAQMVAILGCH